MRTHTKTQNVQINNNKNVDDNDVAADDGDDDDDGDKEILLLKSCVQALDGIYFPSRVYDLQIGEISTNAHHLISMDIFTSRAN